MPKFKYEIVLLDKTSIQQQVSLYKDTFEKMESYDDLLAFWKEKHYNNPISNSLIFGIFIDGVLVGMNAFLPCRYTYKSNEIFCLQSCESAVDRKYQGKGIWGAIIKHSVEYIFNNTQYEVIIGFPNYRNSYPGFLKLGWKTESEMNNFILINNPFKFINIYFASKFLSIVFVPLFLQKFCCWKNTFLCGKLDIREGNVNDVVLRKNKDQVEIYPDKNWLQWKFKYKNEHYLIISENGQQVATCIYYIDSFKNAQVIRLDRIDCFKSSKNSLKQVVSNIILYLGKKYKSAAFFRTWGQKENEYTRVVKDLLFLKSSHPNPFILKMKSEKYSNLDWNLTFFDLD